MLGIIGAMEEEVAELKKRMEHVTVTEKAGLQFFQGKLCGQETVVVKCGVGKVHAAMCTQILADLFSVSGVINTGIAGSLDAKIHIGDIVLATDTVEHDMDVGALGYAPGVNPDLSVNQFGTDGKLLAAAKCAAGQAKLPVQIFTGRVVSGDQFISDKEKKKWLAETFGGRCAEMEGAAIGHVCSLNGIPYLVIRAISDQADDSAETDYPSFAAMAIEHSVALVTAMLELLSK